MSGWLDKELVGRGLVVVDAVATRLQRQLGAQARREELLSHGHFALYDLLRRYEPDRAPLEPYLRTRLRWAMLDGLRRETKGRWPRAIAEASAEVGGADGGTTTPSTRFAWLMRQHAFAMGIRLLAGANPSAVVASSLQPDRLARRRAAFVALREAVEALTDPEQRAVVRGYYFEGRTFAAIADELGRSRGWVSRLHTRALQELAGKLGDRPWP